MNSEESTSKNPSEATDELAAKRGSGSDADSELPMVSGKLVISTMVGVAVVMAGFAWWARYSQSQQVLEVWGKDAVVLIRTGKRVELLRAVEDGEFQFELPTDPTTSQERTKVSFAADRDLTETPGLIHCRHHLVHQKGFDWTAQPKEGCQSKWTVGMRFLPDVDASTSDSDRKATMLFDFSCNRVFLVERQAEVTMRPIIADALKEFFGELR